MFWPMCRARLSRPKTSIFVRTRAASSLSLSPSRLHQDKASRGAQPTPRRLCPVLSALLPKSDRRGDPSQPRYPENMPLGRREALPASNRHGTTFAVKLETRCLINCGALPRLMTPSLLTTSKTDGRLETNRRPCQIAHGGKTNIQRHNWADRRRSRSTTCSGASPERPLRRLAGVRKETSVHFHVTSVVLTAIVMLASYIPARRGRGGSIRWWH